MLASEVPKQLFGTTVPMARLRFAMLLTGTESVITQAFESVTMTVTVPVGRPRAVSLVEPLDQEYE
jgi:hypothetical protein